jgi:hypothetical protein
MSIWALGTLTKVILTSSLGERGSSQLAKGESNIHSMTRKGRYTKDKKYMNNI